MLWTQLRSKLLRDEDKQTFYIEVWTFFKFISSSPIDADTVKKLVSKLKTLAPDFPILTEKRQRTEKRLSVHNMLRAIFLLSGKMAIPKKLVEELTCMMEIMTLAKNCDQNIQTGAGKKAENREKKKEDKNSIIHVSKTKYTIGTLSSVMRFADKETQEFPFPCSNQSANSTTFHSPHNDDNDIVVSMDHTYSQEMQNNEPLIEVVKAENNADDPVYQIRISDIPDEISVRQQRSMDEQKRKKSALFIDQVQKLNVKRQKVTDVRSQNTKDENHSQSVNDELETVDEEVMEPVDYQEMYGDKYIDTFYHSEKNGERVYKCPICSELSSNYLLIRHLRHAHNVLLKRECPFCGKKVTPHYCDVVRHVETMHSEIAARLRAGLQPEPDIDYNAMYENHYMDDFYDPDHKLYRCPVCQKLKKRQSFRQHLKDTHKIELKPVCKYCGARYADYMDLREHVEARHKNPDRRIHCEMCDKQFRYARFYRTHLKRVHFKQQKVKVCEICGEQFKYRKTLQTHGIRKHRDSIDLTPYENSLCKICGNYFERKSDLENHLQTHQGIRVNVCHLCGKDFVRAGSLRGHLRNVHKIYYPCNICNMNFTSLEQLKKHLETHSGVLNYECTICSRKFGAKQDVAGHVAKQHGEVYIEEEHLGEREAPKQLNSPTHLNAQCGICGLKFIHGNASIHAHVVAAHQIPYDPKEHLILFDSANTETKASRPNTSAVQTNGVRTQIITEEVPQVQNTVDVQTVDMATLFETHQSISNIPQV